jgi:hypothetical protein
MFKSKTVFIVGAGASHELNLPVGDDLTTNILHALNIRAVLPHQQMDEQTGTFWSAFNILGGNDPNAYFTAAHEVKDAMPIVTSIDTYLDSRRDNERVVACGKLGIAWAICEAERNSHLFSSTDTPIFLSNDLRAVWHRLFLDPLIRGLSEGELDRMFENVSFIIFNYDRCVEHYLHCALVKIFPRVHAGRLTEVLNNVRFIHPYGVIGKLPWQYGDRVSLPYGARLSPQALVQAASGLRTYTEGVDDKALTSAIQDVLREARRCVFLGFSFQEQNMELLALKERGNLKSVLGTALGQSEDDLEVFRYRVFDAFKIPSTHNMSLRSDLKCHQLFRAYSQSIAT